MNIKVNHFPTRGLKVLARGSGWKTVGWGRGVIRRNDVSPPVSWSMRAENLQIFVSPRNRRGGWRGGGRLLREEALKFQELLVRKLISEHFFLRLPPHHTPPFGKPNLLRLPGKGGGSFFWYPSLFFSVHSSLNSLPPPLSRFINFFSICRQNKRKKRRIP
jgi:hypothetical protein